MKSPTTRFSTRVDNYVKYRPSYPAEVVELLRRECGLGATSVVADIGAGPGNLTRLLLPVAEKVFAVEPNKEMREAGEGLLSAEPKYVSVDGASEATTLGDGSVDLITAGQAFHWFEPEATRAEFDRILRSPGWVALIWNDRKIGSPFLSDYEALLRTHTTEYAQVNHKNIVKEEDQIEAFFAPVSVQTARFPYGQDLDFESLKGRVLSSSYSPEETDPNVGEFIEELRRIFERHQDGGQVVFEYETQVFFGKLK